MTKIYTTKENLVIEIPLKTRRFNPYDSMADESYKGGDMMSNVVGISDGNDYGFGLWIDMDYKGKGDQNTGILYHWHKGQEEFEKFCSDNNIDIIYENFKTFEENL